MTAQVTRSDYRRVKGLLENLEFTRHDIECLLRCSQSATRLWVGTADEKLVCIWGLVPPTILADYAYLWLHVTKDLKGYEFIFIRRSKIAVEEMLKHFKRVIGHCETKNHKAQKWLKWMGAKFGEPSGSLIPFTFEREDG